MYFIPTRSTETTYTMWIIIIGHIFISHVRGLSRAELVDLVRCLKSWLIARLSSYLKPMCAVRVVIIVDVNGVTRSGPDRAVIRTSECEGGSEFSSRVTSFTEDNSSDMARETNVKLDPGRCNTSRSPSTWRICNIRPNLKCVKPS